MQGTQNAALPNSGMHSERPLDVYGGPSGYTILSLLDAPPVLNGKTVTHFTIGVREVDAVASGQIVPIVSFSAPYAVDLLQFQNGNSLQMAYVPLPAQSYAQIRLVVDQPSSQIAFSDGSVMPLTFKTNSGSSSSAGAGASTSTTADASIPNAVDVTVNAPFDLVSGGTASVQADFNVMESLASINSNSVSVRPSLFAGSGAGQITGTVLNQSGMPVKNAVVAAVAPDGSVGNTAATDQIGAFNLHALKANTYRLVIYNAYTNAAGQNISALGQSNAAASFTGPAVTLTAGSKVSAGTITD